MKAYKVILNILFLSICVNTVSFSQEFFINKKGEVNYLRYEIASEWINLNQNESFDFLNKSGFTNIKSNANGEKIIVIGYIYGKEYLYTRRLVFENKLIKEYSDRVTFIQPCLLCMANDIKAIKSTDSYVLDLNLKTYEGIIKEDKNLKRNILDNFLKILVRDGMVTDLKGEETEYGFSYISSLKDDEYLIERKCNIIRDGKTYEIYSEIKVSLDEGNYFVGGYNLKKVNQFDLKLMVDIFLIDCKNNGIELRSNKIATLFDPIEGETLGISYGMNNDNLINLKIDPVKWSIASTPKRWYLIYHELGHDVLNLNHGNGGRMMFNFADKGYSWKEFWNDRDYMFEFYKKNKK